MSNAVQPFNFTNQLYFTVLEQDSPAVMLLYDHSLYMQQLPQSPVYDIVPPGYDNPVRVSAIPKGITAVGSSLLFPTLTADLSQQAPLADGIYIITYRVQPYDTFYYTQSTFRTQMLERQLDEVYVKVEYNNRHAWYNQWKSDLLNIEVMLSTVKAMTRLNILKDANDIYQETRLQANRLINVAQKLTV